MRIVYNVNERRQNAYVCIVTRSLFIFISHLKITSWKRRKDEKKKGHDFEFSLNERLIRRYAHHTTTTISAGQRLYV